MPRRYKLFTVVCGIILAIDQLTKFWARGALGQYGLKGYAVIEGFFHLRLAFNTGSAFSLFSNLAGGRIILSVLGIVALFVILSLVHKAKNEHTGMITTFAFLGGGAIGNIVDRILFGKVTDFILWKYHDHEWPVFNIADAALVAGVALMLILGRKKKEDATEPAKAS